MAQPWIALYSKEVVKAWAQQQIQEQLDNLVLTEEFASMEHEEIECIDQELTEILVTADKQCAKFQDTPWSPKLHATYLEHHYWSIQVSGIKTKQNYDTILILLWERLKIDINDKNHKKSYYNNTRESNRHYKI